MSEEKKQYLLCVDDVYMAFLARIMPGIVYVEVRGLDLTENKEVRALVTPIPKPVKPEEVPPAPEPTPEVAPNE